MADIPDHMLRIKLASHSAMTELVHGRATTEHIGVLIGMNNMTDALFQLGFGTEYADVLHTGQDAIESLIDRACEIGRYVATGPEITALNALLELHDAQMEIVTVQDIEKGLDLAARLERAGHVKRLKKPEENVCQ